MVNSILTGAGFVKNQTYKESFFRSPPKTTYAVYLDSIESRGADTLNLIKDHSVTIELYEYAPDPEAEKRIEEELDARAIEWIKQPRYWIQSEQQYQVIYEFEYIDKKGVN